MAFLSLKDVGKIYVSGNNVTVGIRGVNLDFEKGEFVAVTGKSGSGKSTFLNVVSGMDTYEEGELLIEGQATSHYLQPEWEIYRSEYISFIFQDYNIIESFNVLENVELALMHIEDKKERRKRALELIDRVGMTSHIKHKGSKLSGGQKQRTVIARALAKNSPIILADEPTGNLDSATSVEIIELLKEVSKDKLLIVVTHNYEEVEHHATRHIRFFDGAVESDTVISKPIPSKTQNEKTKKEVEKSKSKARKKNIKDGFTLGKAIFISKPRLSLFLCLLMIIGTFGIFSITSFCGEVFEMFDDYYMFENIEGRVIITKRSGEVISEDELKKLASENGAVSTLHYDLLLDKDFSGIAYDLFYGEDFSYYNPLTGYDEYADVDLVFGESFGNDIMGRYPEKTNEVFLYLPLHFSRIFGEDSIKIDEIYFGNSKYTVTGVKYYCDNTIQGKCLLTEEGFRTLTAIYYFYESNTQMDVTVRPKGSAEGAGETISCIPLLSYNVEEGKLYICDERYKELIEKGETETVIVYSNQYIEYDYFYENVEKKAEFSMNISEDYISHKEIESSYDKKTILIHPSLLLEITEEFLSKSYKQASLFFEDEKTAKAFVEKMNADEYLAVPADTTFEPDSLATIDIIVTGIMAGSLWITTIVFLAFFLNLCSSRTISAFKGDMAIMRSMGISVKVIKIGMYIRMFLSLIPAFVVVAIGAYFIFTTPMLNKVFTFLHTGQYLLIVFGVILLTIRITNKQIKKLFGQSVKKALKGGETE